ncbi:dissimilatory sulfite reductase (desulfoviridin) alpha/beta subunit [Lachnotalea glycerini]|uniref:4Fe-4S dicluster domain-containing protein n=1 Tax=Lachnotalea glycerini TaxID=1763509 RepID=A0A255IFA6_9FIRM|nr:4Fe-4S dicluster domain-containing protein [Lachnotalea glycerini]PXV89189.1 dissimilatory sulfite reductase (desulfoviridin) alpha/beta subunit [Lachnotalea glycerini]RDY31464.1 4Fe-4S dicluster domain-containing protein [Lachnotalea glycerini]
MACTIKPEEIKRVKGLGFLNNKGTDLFNGRIITINGKITAGQAAVIAQAAKKFGNGDVEFTVRLTVEVRGIPFDQIDNFREFIAQAGLETGGTGSLVRPVVSCKGTTCQYGLYDTFAISEKIHKRFYEGYHTVKLPHKFKIATGGCPNNCVKPSLNDLGIVGQLIPKVDEDMCNGCKKCQVEMACPMKAAKLEDGIIAIDKEVCNNCGRCIEKCPFDVIEEGIPGFQVYIGGRWGKKINHGQPIHKIFTSEDELFQVVEKTILLYREQGKTGERFADTIERIGFEVVEKQILSNDILDRKQEILDAPLHLVGGATC